MVAMMPVECIINFVSNIMEIVFTIIGLTIFGLILRALFKDKSVADKPKDAYSWIAQLVISLIVGAFVWFMIIPKSCKKDSDFDPVERMILKSE